MPPKNSGDGSGSMKQKSLMAFFGKAPQTGASKSKEAPQTPKPTKAMTPASASSSVGSIKDTPPTSDVIDVDMDSDHEEVSFKSRQKRRVVTSDEESDAYKTNAKNRVSAPASSPTPAKRDLKRPRVSQHILLEDDEDDEYNGVTTAFTSRLTKFRNAPGKLSSRGSAVSDDGDDFVVPSDSELSVHDHSSALSTSSRRSTRSLSSDGFESDPGSPVRRKKTQALSKGRKPHTGATAHSTVSFLTAAEQRVADKKAEKKDKEDTYSFLREDEIKDKDRIRPGEPGYDSRTLHIPSEAWGKFTPFEKQFWEIKQNHFDTILFFQKGKFFELYEEDARIGHREFDLKITSRVKMSMVGVPEMSLDFWAAKFLAKGYKVGRVDQAETALGAEMRLANDKNPKKGVKGDKIVRRELNKVYTNGTLVDERLLTDDQAGHCVSIRENESENSFGICVLDSSTSEFVLSMFVDDVCRTKLETLVRRLRVKELVFTKGNLTVPTTRLLKVVLPATCLWTSLRDCEGFSFEKTLEEVNALYPNQDGEDNDMDVDGDALNESVPQPIRDMISSKEAIQALGSMIWYLRTLNIDKEILSMKNFNVCDPMEKSRGLMLDGQTLAHIEVLLNSEGTDEGSLLKLLCRCITPFGKRLFRIWLCTPLRDISDINARLDAVEDLIEHNAFESQFVEIAKGLPDLERFVSRVHAKNCKVKDFLKMLNAFRKLSKGMAKLADVSDVFKSRTISGLLRGAPDLLPHLENVEKMYQPPEKDGDELVPQKGNDPDYDEVMAEIDGLEKKLDAELTKLEAKLKCNLSYWNSAQGNKEIYLVQTKASQDNIPRNWTKSGSTKAASRWLVPELQPTIRSLKEARENRNTAAKNFKFRLFAEFDADRAVWLRAIRVFAELDCLFSLAKASVAIGEPSCRPELVRGDESWLDFEELRHPALCVEVGAGRSFIPNDVRLGGNVGRIALLTGPNMGGKSTVMRMTAVGVIMAQLGMLVPARRARLSPVDSILTRMGAYDNMFSHASTFKVELDECCKILRDATPQSFVILDELGRGTSTFDGMAIAGAVLHQLATHTLPLAFFATHYGSLTDDFAYHPNIRNMHMATLLNDEKRELVFLYKLIEGVAVGSFGTHVATLAGVPADVVQRAEVVSDDFAKKFKERIEGKQKKSATSKLPLLAQADFAYLVALASGKLQLPEHELRQKEVLVKLKQAIRQYVAG